MIIFLLLLINITIPQAESTAIVNNDTLSLIEIYPYWNESEKSLFYNFLLKNSVEDHSCENTIWNESERIKEHILWEKLSIDINEDKEIIKVEARVLTSSSQTAHDLCQILYDKSRTDISGINFTAKSLYQEQIISPLVINEIDYFGDININYSGFTLIEAIFPTISNPVILYISYTLITEKTLWGDNFIYKLPLLNFIETDTLEIEIKTDKIFNWELYNFNEHYYNEHYLINDENNTLSFVFFNLSEFNGIDDPYLLISSFTNLEEIGEKCLNFFKINELNIEPLKQKAIELAYAKNDTTAVKNIFNFVSNNISYIALEWGWGGFYPNNPSQTLNNGYGDCKDKVTLLISLLKIVGINAYPVLLSTRNHYDINLNPPAVFFNHVIAAVELNDSLILCDPAFKNYAFGDLPLQNRNRSALILFPDSIKYIKTHSKYESGYTRNIKGDISINGLIEISILDSIYGYLSSYYLNNLTDNWYDKIDILYCKKLPGWKPNSFFKDFTEEGLAILGCRFYKNIFQTSDTFILNIPLFHISLPELNNSYTKGPLIYQINMKLQLPENIEIVLPEKYYYEDTNIYAEFDFFIENDSLYIKEYVEILTFEFSGIENIYNNIKNYINIISKRPLIFTKVY